MLNGSLYGERGIRTSEIFTPPIPQRECDPLGPPYLKSLNDSSVNFVCIRNRQAIRCANENARQLRFGVRPHPLREVRHWISPPGPSPSSRPRGWRDLPSWFLPSTQPRGSSHKNRTLRGRKTKIHSSAGYGLCVQFAALLPTPSACRVCPARRDTTQSLNMRE